MLGIIGGSGLYQLDGSLQKIEVNTPFGPPSAPVCFVQMGGQKVAFLPRHGEKHSHLPGEISFRANIWALKKMGVREILSVSGTGSLKKEIGTGDLAIVNQYLDFTKGRRAASFFGSREQGGIGLVAHISTAKPTCERNNEVLAAAAQKMGIKMHLGKTYVCVEGPRLGTKAESFMWQKLDADLVGMTNVPEAFLAREAQLCYSALAVATDYDCWHEDPNETVTGELVLKRYAEALGRVKLIMEAFISLHASQKHEGICSCRTALSQAVVTKDSAISQESRELLAFLKE